MPITPYVRPQRKIYQNLRRTPAASVARNGALIVGVQYLLALNDGRDMPSNAFSSAGADLLYRHIENGITKTVEAAAAKVKLDSVRLFGENLEAQVASVTTFVHDTNTPNALRLSADNLAGTGLAAALGGRAVRVGDVLKIDVDNTTGGAFVSADNTFYRKVTGLLPAKLVPSVNGASSGTVTAAQTANNAIANASLAIDVLAKPSTYAVAAADVTIGGSANKFFQVGGRYNGKLGEELTIVCVTDGNQTTAQFRVSYASLGESEVVTATDGGDPDEFLLTLTKYDNTTVKLSITGDTAAAGDTVRMVIYPIHAANAHTALIVSDAAAFGGSANTTYVVEVIKGRNNDAGTLTGLILRVYSVVGNEPLQTYEEGVTDLSLDTPLGTLGLEFTVDGSVTANPDFVTGDKFTVAVTNVGVSATAFNGVSLDGPAYDPAAFNTSNGKFSVSVREVFNGQITEDNAAAGEVFTAAADKVTYAANLGVLTTRTSSAFCSFVSGRGNLVLGFKAAVKPAANSGSVTVASTDIVALGTYGELNPENDLAYAAYIAKSANKLGRVRILAAAEDTVQAFTAALNKVRNDDTDYALGAITDFVEVADAVAAHCDSMSDPDNQNFRRCYFGTSSPGEYTVWGQRGDGTYRRATLVGDLVTIHEDDRPTSNLTASSARVGDKIQFLSLSEPVEIAEIVSAFEARVTGAPTGGVAIATAFTLIKPDTPDNTIDYVINNSSAVDTRRAANVWADFPTTTINGEELVVPCKFIAAEVAALRAALPPQQGMTMMEITSVSNAPSMYARFTPEQLDRAAAGGVMVIAQNVPGGDVFIRHQLTTRTSEGQLQWEDSPGVIVDAFSFQIKDGFREFLGIKNITEDTLDEIRTKLKSIANLATQASLLDKDSIGPLIVSFCDEDGNEGEVTVRVDPDQPDHVITYVKVRVPIPLNGISHYVDAEIALPFAIAA